MLRFLISLSLCFFVAVVGKSLDAKPRVISEKRLKRIFRVLSDSDVRIRVQALVVLARLKDKRSVKPLVKVLKRDRSASCRALAAAALGGLGDVSILPFLKEKQRDRSPRVRKQVRLAIGRLAKLRPKKAVKTSYAFVLGSMGAKTLGLRNNLRHLWRKVAKKKLLGSAAIRKEGQKVYKVNASITQLDHSRSGSMVRVLCRVRVMLDYQGSIVMMTTGGATVEVAAYGFRDKDYYRLEHSALYSAVDSAHRNLLNYFKSRQM